MKKTTNFLLAFVLASFSLLSTGCTLFASEEITPETKMAVLRVCDEYLRNLANGMSSQAEAMIVWSDYNDGVSRSTFSEIVKSKKDLWSKEENPLLGLDVVNTEIGGDTATVLLVKKSTGKKIKLKLNWVGRGWVIIGDNILSEDGVFRTS